ncbi:MAG: chlorophyll synthesis pathway protein BchC [Myxococcota bacterium]
MIPQSSQIHDPQNVSSLAIVLEAPERVELREVALGEPAASDVLVALEWSGISTGTERLLFSGEMPPFPGLGYPLVPGYESVGRVVHAGPESGRAVGQHVFVPGSAGFQEVRGLFGGAASHLLAPGARTVSIEEGLGQRGVLLALAATAVHALRTGREGAVDLGESPVLIVGHGALGRLLARCVIAAGGQPPVVWEKLASRRAGKFDYPVIDPGDDDRYDYGLIFDVSGDAASIDGLIARLAPRGSLVLAGFYRDPIRFDFPPAFMREARIRIAAEWEPRDIEVASQWVAQDWLSLDDLVTHVTHVGRADDARSAYQTAFEDSTCIKMVLDWRNAQ